MLLGWRFADFTVRLAFGIATSMALTSPRLVPAGFYRVHLWVLLGLNTLALLLVPREAHGHYGILSLVMLGIVASYFGSVAWLYERKDLGLALILMVGALDLSAAIWVGSAAQARDQRVAEQRTTERSGEGSGNPRIGRFAECVTSGMLLGLTTTAMLLGHWYLITPTMQLRPLRILVAGIGMAVLLRALVCLPDLMALGRSTGWIPASLMGLRWLAGILGVGGMAYMAWQTLRIPNTQSATGILYVAVVLVFLGELTAILLVDMPGMSEYASTISLSLLQ